MSIFDKLKEELYIEHNNLRLNPSSYINILEEDMKHFRSTLLFRPGSQPIQTYEGITAYEEAIQFLKNQPKVNQLARSTHLEKAATLHAQDSGVNGLVSHESSEGRNLCERIEDQCEWSDIIGENIDFGSKTATHLLIALLVDDGVKGRPHRTHLFNSGYNYIGIGVSAHKLHGNITVIGYAGQVRDKGTAYFDYDNYKYEYVAPKKREIKNSFQYDDNDAPDECVSFKLEKVTKEYKGKLVEVTKKIYTLKNGSQHIVEIEDL
jgi:uncharacterized protein YkwD